MTRLILVCHGQTDWEQANRIQGEVDIPLNVQGRRQAKALAGQLRKMKADAIYSSALSRSYDTAVEIAKPHRLKVKSLNSLNEVNQGLWQGMLVEDAKKKHRKLYSKWESNPLNSKPPKGEGIKEAYDRVITEVGKLLARHKDETICIVSHKPINTLIKCHFLGLDLNKIWELSPMPGTWEILEVESE